MSSNQRYGTNLVVTDIVAIINYPIATLFSQIGIMSGGKVYSGLTNTYPYRPYLKTLLNYGKEAKNTQLRMGIFYKDTAAALEETDPEKKNVCLKLRFAFCSQSKMIHFSGCIHGDLMHLGRLLLNSTFLKITLHGQ